MLSNRCTPRMISAKVWTGTPLSSAPCWTGDGGLNPPPLPNIAVAPGEPPQRASGGGSVLREAPAGPREPGDPNDPTEPGEQGAPSDPTQPGEPTAPGFGLQPCWTDAEGKIEELFDDQPLAFVDASLGVGRPVFAISRDGSQLVYVSETDGQTHLNHRPMGAFEVRRIPGTEGALNPFFSPNGQSVGFLADGALKRVSLLGGEPPSRSSLRATGITSGTAASSCAGWVRRSSRCRQVREAEVLGYCRDDRERRAVVMRFMGYTMREVGADVGLSRGWVYLLEQRLRQEFSRRHARLVDPEGHPIVRGTPDSAQA